MAMSGHRTQSMLKRYDIVSLEDLRAAVERGSDYQGQASQVVPLMQVGAVEKTDRTPPVDVRG
jgi:hypothetical protein